MSKSRDAQKLIRRFFNTQQAFRHLRARLQQDIKVTRDAEKAALWLENNLRRALKAHKALGLNLDS